RREAVLLGVTVGSLVSAGEETLALLAPHRPRVRRPGGGGPVRHLGGELLFPGGDGGAGLGGGAEVEGGRLPGAVFARGPGEVEEASGGEANACDGAAKVSRGTRGGILSRGRPRELPGPAGFVQALRAAMLSALAKSVSSSKPSPSQILTREASPAV